MQPICLYSERERSFEIKIEDIIHILDKDHKENGSTLKAIEKLKQLLRDSEN